MEKINKFDAEIEGERELSEANFQELLETYPTVESIVEDYRNGLIDLGVLYSRFPEKSDQEEVFRLAEKRNQSERQ